jgi:2Fe-2S ferredoxin
MDSFPMPKITYISSAGESRQFEVPNALSVMEGGVRNGIDEIVAECGGSCLCATCHVYVDEKCLSILDPMAEDEDAMLESTAAERKSNSRLSCQLIVKPVFEGLIVHTPETQK